MRKLRGRSTTKKDRKAEGEFDTVLDDNTPSPERKSIFTEQIHNNTLISN